MTAERVCPPDWWPKVDPWSGEYLLIAAAKAYVKVLDWPIFPCWGIRPDRRCECGQTDCPSPGKHPRINGWSAKATTNWRQVREWWTRFPQANIGLACGERSGIFVLDIDCHTPEQSGYETLEEWQAQYGAVPETPTSLTGSGGQHLFFRSPQARLTIQAGIGPGVDYRNTGGLVILPPSLHAAGRRYAWEASSHPLDLPLSEIPAWLMALLPASPPPGTASGSRTDWAAMVATGAQPGKRNQLLTRLAGRLFRTRLDPDLVGEIVRAVNAARCYPPLSVDEVRRICNSIAARQAQQERGQPNGD